MEIVKTKKRGDLTVTKDTQYNDLLADNVTVKEGITTRMYGIIKNKLTIEKDSVVYLHGKMPGEFINHGGTLYIFSPSGDITTL